MNMLVYPRLQAHPITTRQAIKFGVGGAVLALALAAAVTQVWTVGNATGPTVQAVPAAAGPIVVYPALAAPAAAPTLPAIGPSEADLTLQAYAPHGG